MNAYKENRVGKVVITNQIYEFHFNAIEEMYKSFSPCKIEYLFHMDAFEMFGFSNQFDQIPKGSCAVEYFPKFIKEGETVTFCGFDRSEL